MPRTLALIAALAFVPLTFAADDWPWWRGPNRDGIADPDQKPPTDWSAEKNVVWKVPVPGRGHSSPIVVGDHVVITTAEEATQSVICYDRATGKQRWKSVIHEGGPVQKRNKKASLASGSVAWDGERFFVAFLHGKAVFATALSPAGEQLWQKKVSDYKVHQGYGASPTVFGPLVLVGADNKGGGAFVAFDRKTGEEVWRHERPSTANYASPIVHHVGGKDQLVFTGCELVTSLDPLTGKVNWKHDGSTVETVTSPATDGERFFISGGYSRNHVEALDAQTGKVVWGHKTRVYVPSMLVKDGYLYAVGDSGIAYCWESATGKEAWTDRLGGGFTSSPVMVGDRIFAINEKGKVFVYGANPKQFDLLATSQLGDDSFATPTIVGGRVYARVGMRGKGTRQEYLYCLGAGE